MKRADIRQHRVTGLHTFAQAKLPGQGGVDGLNAKGVDGGHKGKAGRGWGDQLGLERICPCKEKSMYSPSLYSVVSAWVALKVPAVKSPAVTTA